jgi:coiled-coil domain-containing protein 61
MRQQVPSSHGNEQQQIELLRQMVRTSEETLARERAQMHKSSSKKGDDYRLLHEQVDSLKTSERQLKSKVRSLTNEIGLLKRR